jgi:hypothetical protein
VTSGCCFPLLFIVLMHVVVSLMIVAMVFDIRAPYTKIVPYKSSSSGACLPVVKGRCSNPNDKHSFGTFG